MSYAIIFDMDGVIIDSNPYHKIAWEHFLKMKDVVITDEVFNNLISGTSGIEAIRELINKDLTQKEVDDFNDEIDAEYRNIIEKLDEVKPLNGLTDLLQSIKNAGHKIALATSAPTENVELVLNKFKIFDFFDLVVDRSHVQNGKPSPEIYLTTVKKLSIEKMNCLVFEDSIAGIISAKSAGLLVVGVTTSHEPDEIINAGADFTINDFSEISLEKLVKHLKNSNPG